MKTIANLTLLLAAFGASNAQMTTVVRATPSTTSLVLDTDTRSSNATNHLLARGDDTKCRISFTQGTACSSSLAPLYSAINFDVGMDPRGSTKVHNMQGNRVSRCQNLKEPRPIAWVNSYGCYDKGPGKVITFFNGKGCKSVEERDGSHYVSFDLAKGGGQPWCRKPVDGWLIGSFQIWEDFPGM